MNRIISTLAVSALLLSMASCSKNEEPASTAQETTDTLSESFTQAGSAATDMAEGAIEKVESTGEEALAKASEMTSEIKSKAEEVMSGAEKMADDASTEAAKLKEDVAGALDHGK